MFGGAFGFKLGSDESKNYAGDDYEVRFKPNICFRCVLNDFLFYPDVFAYFWLPIKIETPLRILACKPMWPQLADLGRHLVATQDDTKKIESSRQPSPTKMPRCLKKQLQRRRIQKAFENGTPQTRIKKIWI